MLLASVTALSRVALAAALRGGSKRDMERIAKAWLDANAARIASARRPLTGCRELAGSHRVTAGAVQE